MLTRWLVAAVALFLLSAAQAQQRTLPSNVLRSGIEFAGADVRSMQSDDLANPGFLWVERGEKLWNEAAGPSSCASCHSDKDDPGFVAANRMRAPGPIPSLTGTTTNITTPVLPY